MSKTHPINQSVAALFAPESERIRKDAKEGATARGVSANTRAGITAPQKTTESSAMQDSLGNPMSPGYEMIWRDGKPKTPEEEEEIRLKNDPNYVPAKRPPKNFIHLQTGWEKLLVAQKKICEKARKIWVSLEAAPKYASLKKSKLLSQQKSGAACGFIIDVDSQEYLEQQAHLEKSRKEKEKDEAA